MNFLNHARITTTLKTSEPYDWRTEMLMPDNSRVIRLYRGGNQNYFLITTSPDRLVNLRHSLSTLFVVVIVC